MKYIFIFLILVTAACDKEAEVEATAPTSANEPVTTEHETQKTSKSTMTEHKKMAAVKTLAANPKLVKEFTKQDLAPKGMDYLLPKSISGVKRMQTAKRGTRDHAFATYNDKPRSIRIDLQTVQGSPAELLAFHKRVSELPEKSESKDLGTRSATRVQIEGFRAEHGYQFESKKSEVTIRFHDRVDLRLSVEPAKSEDEAVELIKELKLKEIEAHAKMVGVLPTKTVQ